MLNLKCLKILNKIKQFSSNGNVNKFHSAIIACQSSTIHLDQPQPADANNNIPGYIEFKQNWPKNEKSAILKDMLVIEDFLSVTEEEELITECETFMKRLRYEYDHWDDAIHGFRETERKHWYPNNKVIIEKVIKAAFSSDIIPYVHVLDLAENGVIKPHVDSSRFCGSTIAGLSLMSDSVMRLIRTNEKQYDQRNNTEANGDDYRKLSTDSKIDLENNFYADVLLRKRSLYIMRDTARYNFTHQILGNDCSTFKNELVKKNRRISVICRNKP